WLDLRFSTGQQQMLFENLRLRPSPAPTAETVGDINASTEVSGSVGGGVGRAPSPAGSSHHASDALAGIIDLGDAPTCSFCGSIMTRNGSCYRCGSCGSTSGCS